MVDPYIPSLETIVSYRKKRLVQRLGRWNDWSGGHCLSSIP